MRLLFHKLFLTLLIPAAQPQETPELLKHIENLNHNKYSVRLKSFNYLKTNLDKDIQTLTKLRNNLTWQSEKRSRLSLLINYYFNYPFEVVPSIYAVPFEIRYVGGTDWSKYYYEQITKKYPEYFNSLGWPYRSRSMEEKATLLLYKNLLKNRVDKNKVIELIKQMLTNENKEQYILKENCIPHKYLGWGQSCKIYTICQ